MQKSVRNLYRIIFITILILCGFALYLMPKVSTASSNDLPVFDPNLIGEPLGDGAFKTANRYGQDSVILRDRISTSLPLSKLLEEKAALDMLRRGGISATTLTPGLLDGKVAALSDPLLDIASRSDTYLSPIDLMNHFGDDLDLAIEEVQNLRRSLRDTYSVEDLQGGFKGLRLYISDPECVQDISNYSARDKWLKGLATKKKVYNEFLKPLIRARYIKRGQPIPLNLMGGSSVVVGKTTGGTLPSGNLQGSAQAQPRNSSVGSSLTLGSSGVGRLPAQLRPEAGGPGSVFGGIGGSGTGYAGTSGMMNLGVPVPPYNNRPRPSRMGGTAGGDCLNTVCPY
jgi:hypothetical protein